MHFVELVHTLQSFPQFMQAFEVLFLYCPNKQGAEHVLSLKSSKLGKQVRQAVVVLHLLQFAIQLTHLDDELFV